MTKTKLLFLCTGNSCRSQMAEGWARQLKSDVIEPFSAGVEKYGMNPHAIRVMAEAGVDIGAQRSKTVADLGPIEFDLKPMMRLLRLVAVGLATVAWPPVLRAAATNNAYEYQHSASREVEVVRFDWTDAKRNRKVPVKVYFPKNGDAPFPIIIFSHGLGGSREGYEYLGRHWASHGYVSVHLQHLGSDDAVWRHAPALGKMAAMRKAAADPRNAINRPLDVSFAIDQLEKPNQDTSPLQKRLALDRIGVAGHSFGAFTTLAVAGHVFIPGVRRERTLADPRVKAAIPMSAPVPANKRRLDDVYANIKIPCLHMTGTLDSSPIGDMIPEERRLPFDHSHGSDQFLITFTDGDHMIFSGRGRRLAHAKDDEFHKLICASSTAFWDAYLKDDARARAWLANDFKTELSENGKFEVKLKK